MNKFVFLSIFVILAMAQLPSIFCCGRHTWNIGPYNGRSAETGSGGSGNVYFAI